MGPGPRDHQGHRSIRRMDLRYRYNRKGPPNLPDSRKVLSHPADPLNSGNLRCLDNKTPGAPRMGFRIAPSDWIPHSCLVKRSSFPRVIRFACPLVLSSPEMCVYVFGFSDPINMSHRVSDTLVGLTVPPKKVCRVSDL